ncbi:Iron(3+)-hydroxamate-binding protein YxeB precursor [compost metagenome]
MEFKDHMMSWNHARIELLDIRHAKLEQGEELGIYQFPSSVFLYMVRGSAQIWLDGNAYAAKRFHILHGGKGARLNLWAEEELEYYLIMYRAALPTSNKLNTTQLMEKNNPFYYQYAFAPCSPLTIYDKVEQLSEEWSRKHDFGELMVKGVFYQLVHETLLQMHQQEIEPLRPDLVEQALRYIHEHYHQAVTLDMMSEVLECSAGHLSRLFKSQINNSPIHYLGQVRSNKAAKLLIRTSATLQEIAEQVGYPDAHSFSRSFKKYKGLTPAHFREQQEGIASYHDLPNAMQEIAVQQQQLGLYTDIENHYQYQVGRELYMQRKTKLAVMTLFMCISFILGACGGTANNGVNTPAASDTNKGSNTGAESNTTETAPATRIVSTLKGDVEIPAEPKRVASDQYMGHLLKLGIVPVGVRSFMLTESWIDQAGISEDTLAGIEDLGGFPMNLEKLTYLEPDLIIGSIEDNIESYEKIAPTVFVPYWEGLSTAGPLEKFRRISEIFGKEAEAEQWIAEYRSKVEEGKAKIAGIIKEGETVSIVQIANKALYVLAADGGNYGSSTIYQMLQLPPTEQALNMEEGFENISLEVLPEYMGDHIFVYGSKDESANEVLDSLIWKGLPAVQKGQVYYYGSFGDKGDEFVMEDPYSMELQLETIVNLLLENHN